MWQKLRSLCFSSPSFDNNSNFLEIKFSFFVVFLFISLLLSKSWESSMNFRSGTLVFSSNFCVVDLSINIDGFSVAVEYLSLSSMAIFVSHSGGRLVQVESFSFFGFVSVLSVIVLYLIYKLTLLNFLFLINRGIIKTWNNR